MADDDTQAAQTKAASTGRKISLIGPDGHIIATEQMADDGTVTFKVPDDTELIEIHAAQTPELAWSEADNTDTVVYGARWRSWRLPITVALVALAAALGLGIFQMWPRHHAAPPAAMHQAPAPKPAPPPLAMTSADKMFIDSLNSYGLRFSFEDAHTPAQYDANVIAVGRSICGMLGTGADTPTVIDSIQETYSTFTKRQVRIIVDDAITAYCPQYATA